MFVNDAVDFDSRLDKMPSSALVLPSPTASPVFPIIGVTVRLCKSQRMKLV